MDGQLHAPYYDISALRGSAQSSHHGGIPPEVTSRSPDVNKHGGGVNDLSN